MSSTKIRENELMTLDASDLVAIINATKDSGGIPVSVNLIATTEWTQYLILMVVTAASAFFMFVLMWDEYIKPAFGRVYLKYILWKIQKTTGRNTLVIKHTVSGFFESSMIDIKTMNKIETALRKFNGKPFDLILHTPGGYIFYAQLLSKIIRNYRSEVRAIIPFYAMSGGTLLALSCKRLIMGDFACLGPVDPQVGTLFSYGSAKSWKEVLKRKGRRANDSSIQLAYVGEQYTKTIKNDLDILLSDKILDKAQRELTCDILTNGQLEHAYQLDAERLNDIGIRADKLDSNLQVMLSKVMCNNWIEGVFWK